MVMVMAMVMVVVIVVEVEMVVVFALVLIIENITAPTNKKSRHINYRRVAVLEAPRGAGEQLRAPRSRRRRCRCLQRVKTDAPQCMMQPQSQRQRTKKSVDYFKMLIKNYGDGGVDNNDDDDGGGGGGDGDGGVVVAVVWWRWWWRWMWWCWKK
jgi:hypothetical protein